MTIAQLLQFYCNGSGVRSYKIELCNLYLTLYDHISLEQVQGMTENEKEATAPRFAMTIIIMSVKCF